MLCLNETLAVLNMYISKHAQRSLKNCDSNRKYGCSVSMRLEQC